MLIKNAEHLKNTLERDFFFFFLNLAQQMAASEKLLLGIMSEQQTKNY